MDNQTKKGLKKTLNIVNSIIFSGSCLIGIIFFQQKELRNIAKSNTIESYLQQEDIQKTKINIAKNAPSIGLDNLIANWSYLQFLQYFGDSEARETIGYSASPNYFDAIAKHDPRFVQAYFLLAPATSIFAGEPQKTVEYLEQSLKYITPDIHPKSYYLWVYKAIDEMLFLGNNREAQKSYEMAVQWAEQIDNPVAKKSAKNIKQTAKFVAQDPDSITARIGVWAMVLSSTPDEKVQQKAIKNIKSLGGKITITPEGELEVKVPG